MGSVISRRDFPSVSKQVHQGVFLLAFQAAPPADSTSMNVGLLFGEKLFRAKTDSQEIDIEAVLGSVVNEINGNLLLKNTDVLFNPDYGVDVIRLLLHIGRNRKLFVIWPGEVTSTRLTYSEPNRFDYGEYNINDYVDTYVVL